MAAKHCFDAKCLDLAIYFYPAASADRLNDLAQRIQNEVESEDLDASAPETRSEPDFCDCHCGKCCKGTTQPLGKVCKHLYHHPAANREVTP